MPVGGDAGPGLLPRPRGEPPCLAPGPGHRPEIAREDEYDLVDAERGLLEQQGWAPCLREGGAKKEG